MISRGKRNPAKPELGGGTRRWRRRISSPCSKLSSTNATAPFDRTHDVWMLLDAVAIREVSNGLNSCDGDKIVDLLLAILLPGPDNSVIDELHTPAAEVERATVARPARGVRELEDRLQPGLAESVIITEPMRSNCHSCIGPVRSSTPVILTAALTGQRADETVTHRQPIHRRATASETPPSRPSSCTSRRGARRTPSTTGFHPLCLSLD